jgi:uncharacterized membrane protein
MTEEMETFEQPEQSEQPEQLEQPEQPMPSEDVGITEDDKLWALLSYLLWPLGSILVALMEDKKERPYIKYHAIQAAGLGMVLAVISVIVACTLAVLTFFIGGLVGCCGFVPLLALFYYAYLAYQGDYFEIPYLTDFMKQQGWL